MYRLGNPVAEPHQRIPSSIVPTPKTTPSSSLSPTVIRGQNDGGLNFYVDPPSFTLSPTVIRGQNDVDVGLALSLRLLATISSAEHVHKSKARFQAESTLLFPPCKSRMALS